MSTHPAIVSTGLGKIEQVQLPTPNLSRHEILIEVKYAAMNPVEVNQVDNVFGFNYFGVQYPNIVGILASGIVKSVGLLVDNFKEGDRVTAFTFGRHPYKATQKYAVATRYLTAKLPDSVDLAAASAIPDNYLTAMYTLFSPRLLALPPPPSYKLPVANDALPKEKDTPILIYGAGSTVGQYYIQVFFLSGYRNLIVTASPKHHDYLKSLGARVTIDYHSKTLASDILAASGPEGVQIAVDCIGSRPSMAAYASAVGANARVSVLPPFKDGNKIFNGKGQWEEAGIHMFVSDWLKDSAMFKKDVKIVEARVFETQDDQFMRENYMAKLLPKYLEDGIFRLNPIILIDKGTMLERTEQALNLHRENKLSGEKVVIKVEFD